MTRIEKRMNLFAVVAAIVGVVFLVVSQRWYTAKIENQVAEAMDAKLADDRAREEERQAKLQGLRSDTSVIGTMRRAVLSEGEVTVVAIGSSVTAGVGAARPTEAWLDRLTNHLRTVPDLSGIRRVNLGVPGNTTTQMLEQGKVDVVVRQRPTVVIFETCILNDWGQSVPLAITTANLKKIVGKIRDGDPNVRIILQSPNAIPSTSLNKLGLSYRDYLQATNSLAMVEGWEYIDTATEFERRMVEAGLTFDQVLTDGVHPNDDGYALWFEILRDHFEPK